MKRLLFALVVLLPGCQSPTSPTPLDLNLSPLGYFDVIGQGAEVTPEMRVEADTMWLAAKACVGQYGTPRDPRALPVYVVPAPFVCTIPNAAGCTWSYTDHSGVLKVQVVARYYAFALHHEMVNVAFGLLGRDGDAYGDPVFDKCTKP